MMLNAKNVVIVVLLVVIAVLVLIFVPKKKDPVLDKKNDDIDLTQIIDYHTCSEAGYPVQESFPSKCSTPDGRTFTETTTEEPEVVITAPERGTKVTSPLLITGKAKNNWFFEANLPVSLVDNNGKVLVQKGAQATSDWMTPGYVSFSVSLTFSNPETEDGKLIFEKDNPSGLPQNAGSFAIPVKLK